MWTVLPALTGTAIGAILINEASIANNQFYNGALSMTIFICHTFISSPCATFFLKRVIRSELNKDMVKSKDEKKVNKQSNSSEGNPYRTSTFYLMVLLFLASIIEYISGKIYISAVILQIIVGVLAKSSGLLV